MKKGIGHRASGIGSEKKGVKHRASGIGRGKAQASLFFDRRAK